MMQWSEDFLVGQGKTSIFGIVHLVHHNFAFYVALCFLLIPQIEISFRLVYASDADFFCLMFTMGVIERVETFCFDVRAGAAPASQAKPSQPFLQVYKWFMVLNGL